MKTWQFGCPYLAGLFTLFSSWLSTFFHLVFLLKQGRLSPHPSSSFCLLRLNRKDNVPR